MNNPEISVIIPAKDEERSIQKLYNELSFVLKKLKKPYEIIFIDDGSTDNTFKNIKTIANKDKNTKGIKLRGNFGKAVALSVGFEKALGNIVITMDADLQDDPKEIPNFLDKINEGYDLVSGWKKVRHDPPTKVVPSRVINFLTRALTGVTIHDINCGYKAYKRKVVQNLNIYGELYRFIPIFVAKQNFKITEIPVEHRARKYGKSKYSWDRFIKGALDLMTVVFLTSFKNRPGHFFGSIGLGLFNGGFIIGLYITYLRLTTGSIQNRHPLLYLGILLMIVGVQLVSTGLVSELIIHSRSKNSTEKYIESLL